MRDTAVKIQYDHSYRNSLSLILIGFQITLGCKNQIYYVIRTNYGFETPKVLLPEIKHFMIILSMPKSFFSKIHVAKQMCNITYINQPKQKYEENNHSLLVFLTDAF